MADAVREDRDMARWQEILEEHYGSEDFDDDEDDDEGRPEPNPWDSVFPPPFGLPPKVASFGPEDVVECTDSDEEETLTNTLTPDQYDEDEAFRQAIAASLADQELAGKKGSSSTDSPSMVKLNAFDAELEAAILASLKDEEGAPKRKSPFGDEGTPPKKRRSSDITESWELVPFAQLPNTPDIPAPASEHSLDQDDDVL